MRFMKVAATVVAQKLSQVRGVGQVTVGGSSLPAVRVELNPAALNAQEADGKALYDTHCVKCHGQDGTTPTVLAARFKNMRSLNDPAVYQGVSEDSTVVLLDNGVGIMKPYKGTLTHDEEVAIARYIRTLVKSAGSAAAVSPGSAAGKDPLRG